MSVPHVHLHNWSVDEGVVKIVRDQPPGITPPDDLIAVLDGEAPGEVVVRLQSAPESAAALDDLARLQGGLQRALHRFDCPDPHELGEYVLQLLTPQRQTMLAAHLLGCPRCADEVAQFRSFLTIDELVAIDNLQVGR
jgi:anti-sigma factor RsiW